MGVEHRLRVADDELLVCLPVGRRREDGLLVLLWKLLARLSVLRQEVLANAAKGFLNGRWIDFALIEH